MKDTQRMVAHGFTEFSFQHAGIEKTVFRLGATDQPSVLLMLELPGMTRHTIEFAKRLNARGFTVYLPLMFGKPDSAFEPMKNILRCCISKEFHMLASHKPSLISDWLRALCGRIREDNGGAKIGAIGMCFTGGFVLSLMVDEHVIAPVMAQPGHATGFSFMPGRASMGLPEAHVSAAVERAKRDGIDVLGVRFTKDTMCPPDRFTMLESLLGEHFIRIDIDSSIGNPHGIKPYDHAAYTIAYVDEENHPTRQAFERLVTFLTERLRANVQVI